MNPIQDKAALVTHEVLPALDAVHPGPPPTYSRTTQQQAWQIQPTTDVIQQPPLAETGMVILTQGTPPEYFCESILACLCCCPLIGIFAICYSMSVSQYVQQGNMAAAWEASKKAKYLTIAAVVGGIVSIIACIVTVVVLFVAVLNDFVDYYYPDYYHYYDA